MKISGVEIEFRTAGEGRALLYLHPGDGLDAAAPFLAGLARGHRVLAPSHPGFGGSSRPDGFTCVDDLAYFYLDLIESLDLRDVLLVGVSFGGWIAAEIAIRRLDRLAGAVLVDTVGAKFEGPSVREIDDLFSWPLYGQASRIYADPARQRPDYSQRSDAELARMAADHGSFALYAWSPTLYHPKLAQRLHRIRRPVLVLWGGEDRVVPPAYGRRFAAAIPGARFELIAGAGHYPQVERPEAFVAAIERFEATLPAPAMLQGR